MAALFSALFMAACVSAFFMAAFVNVRGRHVHQVKPVQAIINLTKVPIHTFLPPFVPDLLVICVEVACFRYEATVVK